MEGRKQDYMAPIWPRIYAQIEKQGFSIMLLVAATIYFHIQNTNLQSKIDACTDTRIQYYETQMSYLQTVIQENTRALDRNTRTIQKINPE